MGSDVPQQLQEEQILAGILEREQGYADRPEDRGGPTNYGITLATLRSWRGSPVTVDDVRTLTPEEATAILAARYVAPWRWLPAERLRVFCIDWAVTSWHDNPTQALQAAVGATVDGRLGPDTKRRTLEALEGGRDLFPAVFRARLDYYLTLALDEPRLVVMMRVGTPLQIANLKGWIRRVGAFV